MAKTDILVMLWSLQGVQECGLWSVPILLDKNKFGGHN